MLVGEVYCYLINSQSSEYIWSYSREMLVNKCYLVNQMSEQTCWLANFIDIYCYWMVRMWLELIVKLGANAWLFCTHWANIGCSWIAISEKISRGHPKALMVLRLTLEKDIAQNGLPSVTSFVTLLLISWLRDELLHTTKYECIPIKSTNSLSNFTSSIT